MCIRDLFDNVNRTNPDAFPLVVIKRTDAHIVNVNACVHVRVEPMAGRRGVWQYNVYPIRSETGSNNLSFFSFLK